MPRLPSGAPATGPLTVAVFALTFTLLLALSSAHQAQATPAAPPALPQVEPSPPGGTAPTAPTTTSLPTPDRPAAAAASTSQARYRATSGARETVAALAATAQAQATRQAAFGRASTTQAEATSRAEARRAAEAATEQAAMALAAQAAATATAEAVPATATPEPQTVAQAETPSEPPAEPAAPPPPPPAATHPQVPRLVLASYLAWYDSDSWDGCNISGGDRPLEPYHSDDPGAIGRHVRMAIEAGIDGFLLHWFAPGDRTDANMSRLLEQSQGTGFQSSVVFLRHIWHGSPAPTKDNVADALSHIIASYGTHPNFLRLEGKPVIFFSDMYRVPTGGSSPQAAWQEIRDRVDPHRDTWWIAEGLDPSYLSVFDGLYVYKITHASDPAAYLKAGRWAEAVRQAEASAGQPKLWVGTISPGYDDRHAGCKSDVRVPSGAQYRDREGGAFYRATYDAAVASNPDWLLVQSFNEWVEGTYVEPSVQYGDLYLQLTRELAQAFR
ncbi:MAG: hypothetical protein HPY83_08365 [Anaerolineae bacterium]|nr:hypothetical protein [Anaerolineae bacterium]